MLKKPFFYFLSIFSFLFLLSIFIIESKFFVKECKYFFSEKILKNIGLEVDFSNISIQILPPGLSFKDPKIKFNKKNSLSNDLELLLKVERIDLSFYLFQSFFGNIKIKNLNIFNGFIDLKVDSLEESKKNLSFYKDFKNSWKDLIQFKVDSTTFNNVHIALSKINKNSMIENHLEADFEKVKIDYLILNNKESYSFDILSKKFLILSFKKSLEIELLRAQFSLNELGIMIKDFFLINKKLEVSCYGNLTGHGFDPSDWDFNLNLKLNGLLDENLEAFRTFIKVPLPFGKIHSNIKLSGKLLSKIKRGTIESDLKIYQFKYYHWIADCFQTKMKLALSANESYFDFLGGSFFSKEKPRLDFPGEGGVVEIMPFRVPLKSYNDVKFKLKFKNAHIHWLSHPFFQKIYPLDFRLNGDLIADLSFLSDQSHSWKLNIELDTTLKEFKLDNQRFGKKKELHNVFNIPEIHLKGPLVLDSFSLKPDVLVSLPHTKLKLKGLIDFKKGYRLVADGNVDLVDFKEIAENKIFGIGSIKVSVHGPFSATIVDIDTDIKDACYLNLFLGSLKGRISWDDDQSELSFQEINVLKNNTYFKVLGFIRFDQDEKVWIEAKCSQGNISDIIKIFNYLIQPLDWFPNHLNGEVQGIVQVSGGLSYSKLKISTEIFGKNWEFWNEKFQSVQLKARFSEEKYFIDHYVFQKKIGKILGKISFNKEKIFDCELETLNLELADIDFFNRIDVPVRGKVKANMKLHLVNGVAQSAGTFSVNKLLIGNSSIPDSFLEFSFNELLLTIKGFVFGSQCGIDFLYSKNLKNSSYCRLNFKDFDLSAIILLINKKMMQDHLFSSKFSAELDLSYKANQLDQFSGLFALKDFSLQKDGVQFNLEQPIFLEIDSGNFSLKKLILKSQNSLCEVNLRSKKSILEGGITGEIDASLIEFFIPNVSQVAGKIKINCALSGNIFSPQISGEALLERGMIKLYEVDSIIENVTAKLLIKENLFLFKKIEGDVGGGRLVADGKIVFSGFYPVINFKIGLQNCKLKIYPFQYIRLNGDIMVTGDMLPYQVSGYLVSDLALLKEKIMGQKSASAIKSLQYFPPVASYNSVNYPKFKLNLNVDLKKDLMIYNDLLRDVRAKGKLRLINNLESPIVLGKLNINQGKIIFKNNIFSIHSATLNFNNPIAIDPIFDVNAITEINGIKVKMFASGRSQDFKVDLSSTPSMPESEILTLLAIGLTSADARKIHASDLSLVQQGEAASLLLHSLDFNREIEEKTGFHLQFGEAFNTYQGASAFQTVSSSDVTVVTPQIMLSKRLGERLSLSLGSTFGTGVSRSNQFNIDYFLDQNFSFSGVINNYGVYNPNDSQSSAQSTQNSFGLDLKFQKRFK